MRVWQTYVAAAAAALAGGVRVAAEALVGRRVPPVAAADEPPEDGGDDAADNANDCADDTAKAGGCAHKLFLALVRPERLGDLLLLCLGFAFAADLAFLKSGRSRSSALARRSTASPPTRAHGQAPGTCRDGYALLERRPRAAAAEGNRETYVEEDLDGVQTIVRAHGALGRADVERAASGAASRLVACAHGGHEGQSSKKELHEGRGKVLAICASRGRQASRRRASSLCHHGPCFPAFCHQEVHPVHVLAVDQALRRRGRLGADHVDDGALCAVVQRHGRLPALRYVRAPPFSPALCRATGCARLRRAATRLRGVGGIRAAARKGGKLRGASAGSLARGDDRGAACVFLFFARRSH